MTTIHLILVGFGVLVYQLAIYPFLAKYFGPIKTFRPAAVREKYIFDGFLVYLQGMKNLNKIDSMGEGQISN
jgi:hypothetical protein